MAESCCGGHKLAEKEVGSRNKNAPCWKPPYFTGYASLNFNKFILTAPILIQFFSGGTYELNSPEKSTFGWKSRTLGDRKAPLREKIKEKMSVLSAKTINNSAPTALNSN